MDHTQGPLLGLSLIHIFYDESTGETWRDHLLDVAIQTLTQQAAIANEAQASGYTMSAQALSLIHI